MERKVGIFGDTSEAIDTGIDLEIAGDNSGDNSSVCSSSGIKRKS